MFLHFESRSIIYRMNCIIVITNDTKGYKRLTIIYCCIYDSYKLIFLNVGDFTLIKNKNISQYISRCKPYFMN